MKLNTRILAIALMSAIALSFAGCKKENKKSAADYGPTVEPEEVKAALREPILKLDATTMKVGEFVHFSDTQMLNNQVSTILSDTGQTVVDRIEDATSYTYTIVENQVTYSNDGSHKVSRELSLAVAKPSEQGAPTLAESTDESDGENISNLPEHVNRMLSFKSSPLKAMDAAFDVKTQEDVRVTYHNLRVGLETVAPPENVQQQPNCLNIPNCQIKVYNISYDQVTWKSESEGDKITFEFKISTEVPYLAAIMDKCVTLLVDVAMGEGEKTQRVLVHRCTPVEAFRYEAVTP